MSSHSALGEKVIEETACAATEDRDAMLEDSAIAGLSMQAPQSAEEEDPIDFDEVLLQLWVRRSQANRTTGEQKYPGAANPGLLDNSK